MPKTRQRIGHGRPNRWHTGLADPVGFSLERKIVTSTSGISWIRSER